MLRHKVYALNGIDRALINLKTEDGQCWQGIALAEGVGPLPPYRALTYIVRSYHPCACCRCSAT
jgi:hypothetical protein